MADLDPNITPKDQGHGSSPKTVYTKHNLGWNPFSDQIIR